MLRIFCYRSYGEGGVTYQPGCEGFIVTGHRVKVGWFTGQSLCERFIVTGHWVEIEWLTDKHEVEGMHYYKSQVKWGLLLMYTGVRELFIVKCHTVEVRMTYRPAFAYFCCDC